MDQAGRPASDNAITSTLHSLAPVLRRYHRSSTKQTVSSGGPQQSSLTEGKKPIIWSKQLLAAGWCVIENRGTCNNFYPVAQFCCLFWNGSSSEWQKCRVVSEIKKNASFALELQLLHTSSFGNYLFDISVVVVKHFCLSLTYRFHTGLLANVAELIWTL